MDESPGQAPFTLLDYFPDDYLMVIDESHVTRFPRSTVSIAGDKSRKDVLVEHGFRLPSALDNRPLRFDEWYDRVGQAVLLSATPGDWELRESGRAWSSRSSDPLGLVDPEVIVRPTKGQIDDLVGEIQTAAADDHRVLVTTLTKKMAEDLTDYLLELGVRARYLHSDIDTLERVQILQRPPPRRIRRADRRQPPARGSRPPRGRPRRDPRRRQGRASCGPRRASSRPSVVPPATSRARSMMYADEVTDSMQRAINETNRRRMRQLRYNEEHGIDPQTIRKRVSDILELVGSSE